LTDGKFKGVREFKGVRVIDMGAIREEFGIPGTEYPIVAKNQRTMMSGTECL